MSHSGKMKREKSKGKQVQKCVLLFPPPSQNPDFVGFGKLRFLLLFSAGTWIQQRCVYRMPTVSMYQPDVVQSPNQQLTMVHYMDEIIVCIMGSAQHV